MFSNAPADKSGLMQRYIQELDAIPEKSLEKKENRLLLFDKGSNSGWTYVREVPMQSLFSSAKAVREFTIIITVISITISFFIAFVLARMLTRRISILSNKIEQVENLSLDGNAIIDGRDEIGALYKSYNRMLRRIKELVEQLKVSQQQQKESEVKALQAQINPHFLYNTLATINWMAIDKQNDKIISMVDNLSIFYRMSLNKGREFLTVSEEIEQVMAYTEIQKIRLGNRITVVYDIEESIKSCSTLKLILQPFVENAILHGMGHRRETMTIRIGGYSEGETIVFEIEDDGIGMASQSAPEQYRNYGGYGIYNVHQKIQLQYGSEFGVELISSVGKGSKVTILIPLTIA